MAAQELIRELLDLIAVHGFYLSVLENRLGYAIPLPMDANRPADRHPVDHCLFTLRRWLGLLDFAISPPMVRDALKADVPHESAEAMLRYFIDKSSHSDGDRDKADCVVTFLYRNPKFGAMHEFSQILEAHDAYSAVAQVVLEFEAEIYGILGDLHVAALKPEHVQLLREFEFLYGELADFRTFDKLMDSGIVQRVRDLKQSFGESFYHPDVLANVAVYNAVFGRRFDDLFRTTAEQIKVFAVAVQQQGASIMSRLEGDITVKQLADVEEKHLLNQEYGRAQEQFRNISKFKKVVDKRGPGRRNDTPIPGPAPVVESPRAPIAGSPAAFKEHFAAAAATSNVPTPQTAGVANGLNDRVVSGYRREELEAMSANPRAAVNAVEESKIRTAMENIRSFVRAADAKACFVVPLTKGSINITPVEAEALRADYGTEKSFRADYANCMSYLVALMARLEVEIQDFIAKQSSAYLWKNHADAITYIIQISDTAFKNAEQVIAVAQQRGLAERVNGMKATMLRVQKMMQEAAAKLQSITTQKQAQ